MFLILWVSLYEEGRIVSWGLGILNTAKQKELPETSFAVTKNILETPGKAGCEEEQLHPSGVSLPRHPLQSVEQDAPLRRNSELEQF